VDQDGARSVTRRKEKIQVSENTAGKPRALAVSVPRRGGTGQKDAGKYASALKNRLDLAFAKDLAPVRV
jgi:hypothetical protein